MTTPSTPPPGGPASTTAEGASSSASGPVTAQNNSSISKAGSLSRQVVTVLEAGTCQPRTQGTSARGPARRGTAPTKDPSGLRVIATNRHPLHGRDQHHRR